MDWDLWMDVGGILLGENRGELVVQNLSLLFAVTVGNPVFLEGGYS